MADEMGRWAGIGRLRPSRAAGLAVLGGGEAPAPQRLAKPGAAPGAAPGEPGVLQGDIARCDHAGAAGWALDAAHPGRPVGLEALVDGVVVGRAVADLRRPDLEMAGLGDGRCGFALRFTPRLRQDRGQIVQLRRAADGADVPGSPLLLERVVADLPALLATVDQAATADTMARRDEVAEALAHGIAALVQMRVF